MLFITESSKMAKIFDGLCDKYSHIEIAVAWAGNPDDTAAAKALKKNEKKITKMVVGLHFYQTSPAFINRYKDNDKVRFMVDTKGVFHPKVYLFYNTKKDWTAIIGSSNFTYGGFTNNTEANVLIECKDTDEAFFAKMESFITREWGKAKQLTTVELKEYEKCHKYQKPNLKSLSHLRNPNHLFDTTEMDLMTWDSYVSKVQHTDSFANRIALLDVAQQIFAAHKSFHDIDSITKKSLAGFQTTMPGVSSEIDWRWFGSMKGAGAYKHAINSSDIISKAIDRIPLSGDITKHQFDAYCKAFVGWDNPLACATRLLCIKRPDWFICVDSKNKTNLCKAFGISKNSLTLASYWDKIVLRVREAMWFNDKGGTHSPEVQKIKNYQVAMLDTLYYEE